MKEHRLVALHVACGDIVNVAIENDKFIIKTEDGMLTNLLKEGKREIERALSWQGLDLKVEIEILQKEKTKAEEDIENIKSKINDIIIIKGE